jgi:hypothetical protein
MEHRWDERIEIEFDVTLCFDRFPPLRGRGKNLSLNGMLVACERPVFHKNTTIDVEFQLSSNDRICHFRIPSLVVHCSSRGLGLLFQRMEPATDDGFSSLGLHRPHAPMETA